VNELLRGHLWRAVARTLGVLLLLQACQPKGAISSSEEEIREGWRLYRLSEFNSAVKIFQSVQAAQPRASEYHLQALYGEASCWSHRRDGRNTAKAVAAYQAVIEQAPENDLAAWCALDIVRSRHLAPPDQPVDYQSLVADYAEVYQRYAHSLAGEEAFLYQSALSVHLADVEQVRKLLEQIDEFLSSHPETPYLSQFYEIIAECYRKTGDADQRIQYLIKALDARPVDPASPTDDRSTAYWNIAYAAEFEAGNFGLARQYYQLLIDEYPQDIRILGVRKALERMDAIEAALREGRDLTEVFAGGAASSSLLEGKK
jgi:tetratricopeptide (TPR) repeat protein